MRAPRLVGTALAIGSTQSRHAQGVRACRGLFLLGFACFHGRFGVTFGPDLGLTNFGFGCPCHPSFRSER